MNITELFTQIDVNSNLKPTPLGPEKSRIPDVKNRYSDRDDFRKELERTRTKNSQAAGASTENRPEDRPVPETQSEVRNPRSTEEIQPANAQNDPALKRERTDSGKIPQDSTELNDSTIDELKPTEETETLLDENQEELFVTDTEVNPVGEELIIPPEGLTEVFDAAEENTSDSELVHVTTIIEEENLTPPASLFESEKTGSEQENPVNPAGNIQVLSESDEPEVLVNPEPGDQENIVGPESNLETEEVLLNEEAEKTPEETGKGKKPEVSNGETVSREKLEALNDRGVFDQGNAQNALGLEEGEAQETGLSTVTEPSPETASVTPENPRENKRNQKANENVPVGQVSENALNNASDQSVLVAAGSEVTNDSSQIVVSEHLAEVATKVEAGTENEIKGLDRAVEVTSAVKPGIPESVKTDSAGNTKAAGQNGESKLVDQVSSAVQRSAISGKQMRVRLSPPELGTLMVEVTAKDGVLTARLEVQSQSAQQAIMDNLSQLKESLVQSGNNVESIQVHVNQTFTEESGREQGWEQNENRENPENFDENSENQPNEGDSESSADEQSGQHLQLDELDIQV